MYSVRKTYEKLLNGDAIDDKELAEAVLFFENLASQLRILGPVFYLAANEATRAYHALKDFQDARKRK